MPLFTPPSRPETPNVPTTIEIVDNFSVPAASVYYGDGINPLFTSYQSSIYYDLINAGTLWARGSTLQLLYAYNFGSIINSGTIVAEATAGSAETIIIGSHFEGLVNSGSIYALATGGGAFAVQDWASSGIDIVNSGLIAAASNIASIAVWRINGGTVINQESGSILAEGPNAIAIVLGRGRVTAPGQEPAPDIVNHGLIEARSPDLGAPSAAIVVSNLAVETLVIENYGTIRGDFAVYGDSYAFSPPQEASQVITNHAGGIIEGVIFLDLGDDRVNNAGLVDGYVDMGEGNDFFDNRLGQHIGNAEMGIGNDTYFGGSGFDVATGNRGNDLLDGGAGEDLLLGGWGNDTLVGGAGNDGLFGEANNDRIVTTGSDRVDAGSGDDRVELGDYHIATAVGGTGRDILVLPDLSRTLDLSTVIGSGRIAGFEEIVLNAQNRLVVRPTDIASLTGGSALMMLSGQAGTVDLVGAWTPAGTQLIAGTNYTIYTSGAVQLLVAQTLSAAIGAAPPGALGLDSVTGDAAPLPGAAPGADLTSNTTYVSFFDLRSDLEIGEQEEWISTNGQPVIFGQSISSSLINRGLIEGSGGESGSYAVSGNYFERVINYGTIDSRAFGGTGRLEQNIAYFNNWGIEGAVNNIPGNAFAVFIGSRAESFVNFGTIHAATDQGIAFGYVNYSSPSENHGSISAYSMAFNAVAAYVHNGGSFINSGQLTATGQWGAFGLVASQHTLTLWNSGTIQAEVTGAGRESIGVSMAGLDEQRIFNSGSITADIAIRLYGSSDGLTLWLENSGEINGRIELASGPNELGREDFVLNRGTINGDVSLGGGRDVYDGSLGVQIGIVRGGDGNDLLIGTSLSDNLDGGSGDDLLVGGGGDTLIGGAGSDTFRYTLVAPGVSEVIADFATGVDRIDLRALSPTSVSITGSTITAITSAGTLSIQVSGAVSMSDILVASASTFTGTANNDLLVAGGVAATLYGGDGVDILVGSNGNDRLDGGPDGSLQWRARADIMWGGLGDDTYVSDSPEDRIIEHDQGGLDTVEFVGVGGGTFHVPYFVERAFGGDLQDRIEGNSGDEWINGGLGNDYIAGGAGVDQLTGGFGIDEFYGTAAELDGDTITDFGPGDRIWISDANATTFSYSLNGSELTFSGGSLTLSNAPTLPIIVRAMFNGGVQLILAPPDPDNDFIADGKSDILWRNNDGTIGLWFRNFDGKFHSLPQSVSSVSNYWTIVGTGDFNGDGSDDILWRGENGEIGNWLANFNQSFSYNAAGGITVVGPDWQVEGIGDFNADGKDDILWRNADGTVGVWSAQSNGGYIANNSAAFNVSNDWQIVGTGDFNGDGRDDILWRHDSGTFADWLANGSGGFTPNNTSLVGISNDWHIIGTGDFNGDGRDDILWRHESGTIANWLANRDGTFSPNFDSLVTITNDWHVAAIGDYTNDGQDDVLWRHDSGAIGTWRSLGTGVLVYDPAGGLSPSTNDWHVQSPETLWL